MLTQATPGRQAGEQPAGAANPRPGGPVHGATRQAGGRLQDARHTGSLPKEQEEPDPQGRGVLTKDDLRSCLRTLGHNPTEQQLWRFMARVDVDHSGSLDFQVVRLFVWQRRDLAGV